MKDKKLIKKILIGLTAIGPGLFLIGYNIGTGSITTMAKVGAEHGMALTWALVLSCIFTYILMVAYGQTTLVTGKTALSTIKTSFKYGKVLAIYILIALIIGEILALMGIFGIVTDLIQEASKILFGGPGFNTLTITTVLVVSLYVLLWIGKYQVFEKFLIVLVILMGLSFITVFIMVKPSFASIAGGLVPSIPKTPRVASAYCCNSRDYLFGCRIYNEEHSCGRKRMDHKEFKTGKKGLCRFCINDAFS